MANPSGKGGFRPLPAEALERLKLAALDPKNITYSDIARAAGLFRSTAIKHILKNNFRPRGNLMKERGVKQPVKNKRVIQRKERMKVFVLSQAVAGNPVGVNFLRGRYGGTKAAAGEVLLEVEQELSEYNAALKRLSTIHNAQGKIRTIGPAPKSVRGKVRIISHH
ncbi:MAG: hypothetical protein NTY48_01065 [Candidatus Diapherotrites archaeon]|nr:hypothetical protein [Candidatus Diapherotrites archaeon]